MSQRHDVTEADTAAALGSGDVSVLGTPRLVAWLEAATVRAAADVLTAGQTSVGIALRVEHVRATPVGGFVSVEAELIHNHKGRRLTFDVRAVDSADQLVASGQIDRAVVDREHFVRSAYGK